MSRPSAAGVLLRLRLALLRANPLTLAAAVLFVAMLAGTLWMMRAVWAQQAAREQWQAKAARAAAATPADAAPALSAAPDNLALFYASLGRRRYAEQQVRTLFALAAKNGLTLAQGEYKRGYDRDARVYTYQIQLPLKGSYVAIWQFAMDALRAIPFGALDDIGFRRDAIGDTQVEARLRLTLYLTDDPADGRADRDAGGAP